jgi:putative addiction module killer protein
MTEIRQTEVYRKWFDKLRDRQARSRILARIRRLSLGNPGDVKPVGEGVSELRIDYGPGYRVYFVQRGRPWSCCSQGATRPRKTAILRPRWNWREVYRSCHGKDSNEILGCGRAS